MRFIQMTLVNIKRMFKNPTLTVFLIALPLFIIFSMKGFGGENSKTNLYLVNNDKSVESNELTKELKEFYNISIIENKDSIKNDENKGPSAVLVLDKGYGKKVKNGEVPNLSLHEFYNSSENLKVQNTIYNIVKEDVENNILKLNGGTAIKVKVEEEVDKAPLGLMSLMMLIYFFLIGSQIINEDLLKLKNQNILKRALTTANDGRTILASTFLGIYLYLCIMSIGVYLILSKLGAFEDINKWNGMLAIILANLLFIAINIFTVRWFKEPKLIMSVGTVISMVLFLLGIIGVMGPLLPGNFEFISVIAVISPFYWISEIVVGKVMVGTIAMLLITLVIFTTGSYRLKDFASNN